MNQDYLRDKLKEYIAELELYHHKLQRKSKASPHLSEDILFVMDRIDLEKSYLNDELGDIQRGKSLEGNKLKHTMAVVMDNYGGVLDEIHRVLGKEDPKVTKSKKSCEVPKQREREKDQRMKEFAQELNSSWMEQLLQKQKEKKINTIKTLPVNEPVAREPSRREQAISSLHNQVQGLNEMANKMKLILASHTHPHLLQQLQLLKQQEKQLVNCLEDTKESNLFLHTEYQKLQNQLSHLRKHKQILIQDE